MYCVARSAWPWAGVRGVDTGAGNSLQQYHVSVSVIDNGIQCRQRTHASRRRNSILLACPVASRLIGYIF